MEKIHPPSSIEKARYYLETATYIVIAIVRIPIRIGIEVAIRIEVRIENSAIVARTPQRFMRLIP